MWNISGSKTVSGAASRPQPTGAGKHTAALLIIDQRSNSSLTFTGAEMAGENLISFWLSKPDFTDNLLSKFATDKIQLKKPSDRLLPLQLNSFQARRRSAVEPLGDHKVHVQPYQDKLMLNSSCLPGPYRNSESMACCNRCTDCQRRTPPALLCVCVSPGPTLEPFYLRCRVQRPRQTQKTLAGAALQQTHEYQCGNSRLTSKQEQGGVCVCVCGCALAGGRHT